MLLFSFFPGFLVVSFLQVFELSFHVHLSFLPYMPVHILLLSLIILNLLILPC